MYGKIKEHLQKITNDRRYNFKKERIITSPQGQRLQFQQEFLNFVPIIT
jgi:hypothetical protein